MLTAPESAEALRRTFDVSSAHLIMGLVSWACTILCILVHYEAMSLATRYLPHTLLPRRARIVGLLVTLMAAHVVEVWIFGLAYWYLDAFPALGRIEGTFDEGALDFIYFSVVTFSTLGFGDFIPTGAVTILCGTEALLGLSFIAWTASIAFLEMQRDWVEFQRANRLRYDVRRREQREEEP